MSSISVNKTSSNTLFDLGQSNSFGIFPSTRYQGSKYKIVDWISEKTKDLEFDSVLDAFGGSGSVGYMFKKQGKLVYYNDYLKFNYTIGLALIENKGFFLEKEDVNFILKKHSGLNYPTFIGCTTKCTNG